MLSPRMIDYAATAASFRWTVPERFNFARDVVDHSAADPAKPALLWCNEAGRERRFTFDDIARASCRFANLLAAHGVGKGDRVVVMLPRLPEWQIAMVGTLRAGAIPIPCIDMLTAKDVAYRVGHSGAVAAVTTAANTAKFADAARFKLRVSVDAADGWLELGPALAAEPETFAAVALAADDPAIMYYTSGSTGNPKGVTHAAHAIWAWRVSAWYWLDLRPGDLMWCTADTGWSKAGTSILFGPWSCGAQVLFYDGRFDPRLRLELLARHRVTVFCAAATELRRLIAEDFSGFDLSALRLAVSAGETVNPEVVRRWVEKTGRPLLDGYGQTETLMTVLNYPCLPVKPGSMGKPLPGTEVALVAPGGTLARGSATGELAVRLPNPQVMLGYWQEPAKTAAAKTVVDGVEYWLSGDVVRRDDEGYLFYEGRADDVISSAGYRIGPMEVENALIEHPAVQESAAVASPDPERGEVVKAFVVLRPGHAPSDALARELQEHAKRVTAPYKYPRRIEFVAELPKTASGKLRRRELRDREFARANAPAIGDNPPPT
ncbi:MAG TPA: AMP-binding protein [Burkholderiales bacterium]|nr:AMP-binding protein [Burkholderiales bacterium]